MGPAQLQANSPWVLSTAAAIHPLVSAWQDFEVHEGPSYQLILWYPIVGTSCMVFCELLLDRLPQSSRAADTLNSTRSQLGLEYTM